MRKVIFVVISLAIGVFIGNHLNHFLAIKIKDKKLPQPLKNINETTPRTLKLRMVDMGGVGIVTNPKDWGNSYSHNTRRFENVFLTEEPFVSREAFEKVFVDYCKYIDHTAALGFNAIEIPGFLKLVDFKLLGSGREVYAPDSVYIKRHEVLRHFYRRFFDYAQQKNMQVFLKTDMVALNGALKKYFHKNIGSLDVENKKFWTVYQKGLQELFTHFPQVRGMIIRVGEAGAVYNRPGYDYGSELLVRSITSVQKMLRAFLEVAEQNKRFIMFRTWSVGVGEVGHMHTNPHDYKKVLGELDSENLIISTKLCQGDFWNHLPLNPTLFRGKHKRVVELQARREFEAFNVIPNYLGPLHHTALNSFLQHNENIHGIWLWTQSGGPLRRGPMMTYPFHGLWLWTDANVYSSAMIAQNPHEPVEKWTRSWVAQNFGEDEKVITTMCELLQDSHQITAQGLTIPTFARKYIVGLGLEVPPVIYCYWDIVDSSTSIASHLYFVSRNNIDETISEIFALLHKIKEKRKAFSIIKPKITKGRHWLPAIERSLAYQENLFETLAYHKKFLLKFYQWVDNGGTKDNWRKAIESYHRARKTHYEKYKGNLDFPAYNFTLADFGSHQALKSLWVIWLARILVIAILTILVLYYKGKDFLASTAVIATLLLWLFTSFTAPTFSCINTIAFIIYFVGLKKWIVPRTHFSKTMLPLIIFSMFICVILSLRGPFYFWLNFWTNDSFRLLLCGVSSLCILGHICIVLTNNFHQSCPKLLMVLGVLLVFYGSVFTIGGFENMLACFNDELLAIPGMTSRILGITTHLNIPTVLPYYVLYMGATLCALGIIPCLRKGSIK
ncbi:hypothetical protein [Candidatus Uabimicrobium amorphum]|uniref:Glycosyl hydrolase family 67 C-terminal domain-containing protein n=1 Tax=Uabimicrobium amorphum TaxID=2596890 RepID=A0A5S9IR15_UABAM|nr:hypothetical protein [Candidatus Uabimicrobium amorphum]BBM86001.1 hypothetical protein UABAM_04387 [Candidatus Uabimicrobium amorphum]